MKLDASDFTDGAGSAGLQVTHCYPPRTGGATDATPAAGDTHPLTLIARMARLLDQQNVDSQGRWLILDPVFMEVLKDEDSRLFNADFGGSGLQNGQVPHNIHGFTSLSVKQPTFSWYWPVIRWHKQFIQLWCDCCWTFICCCYCRAD